MTGKAKASAQPAGQIIVVRQPWRWDETHRWRVYACDAAGRLVFSSKHSASSDAEMEIGVLEARGFRCHDKGALGYPSPIEGYYPR